MSSSATAPVHRPTTTSWRAVSNACVLHYNDSNRKMQDGDLLLIDAGCEYEGYASDITAHLPGQRQIHRAGTDDVSGSARRRGLLQPARSIRSSEEKTHAQRSIRSSKTRPI